MASKWFHRVNICNLSYFISLSLFFLFSVNDDFCKFIEDGTMLSEEEMISLNRPIIIQEKHGLDMTVPEKTPMLLKDIVDAIGISLSHPCVTYVTSQVVDI